MTAQSSEATVRASVFIFVARSRNMLPCDNDYDIEPKTQSNRLLAVLFNAAKDGSKDMSDQILSHQIAREHKKQGVSIP